jgi:hypothetical protein
MVANDFRANDLEIPRTIVGTTTVVIQEDPATGGGAVGRNDRSDDARHTSFICHR